MNTGEEPIRLRVKVPARDDTAVIEMTGPVAPDNGLQAFGDWVLAAPLSSTRTALRRPRAVW